MIKKCPGSQAFSQPHPEFIKCPYCGAETEIWSDEVKTKCHKCGKTVTRESGHSCLDWCRYANECIGEETHKKYLRNKKLNNSKN